MKSQLETADGRAVELVQEIARLEAQNELLNKVINIARLYVDSILQTATSWVLIHQFYGMQIETWY